MMIAAVGIGLSTGWMMPAQTAADPAKGPQWKDRAEYDVAAEFSAAKDAKGRVAALDKWSTANPDSEFAALRDEYYLGAFGELKDYRKAFDKAKAMRAKNPNSYFAITTILNYVYGFPAPRTAPDLATAEETAKYVLDNADKIFVAGNKPASQTPEQWTPLMAQRPAIMALALRTNAWVWFERKDDVRAETELTKVIQADGDQPLFSYMLGQSKFNQQKKDITKIPGAMFHIARAAVYAGPNAATISAANRDTYLKFVTSIYKQYHGSEEGLPELLALAKANAMPPADFTVKSITQIETEKFANAEEYDKAHPQETFWRDAIRTPLQAADSDAVFASSYKDALLPPPGQAFGSMFKAKIISMAPATSPKELIVAVHTPGVADAKLTFATALPGDMPEGSEIEFKGTVTAYQKDPFMVTFAIDMDEKEMTGWTGVAPAGKGKAKAAPAKPKAAPKGKAK